ncbi:hypothetical protein [Paraburkholderia acidisoli]|uniref:Uncharacterized protein n=1 Tax=Paraburkholderia acidisoli TaxID=2571748 RepID=A0A7Z2GR11_9BURK|nr:hypothetical protein [Paraburkholderia acidisoli]QGZ66312.1 hypothetical protein FAZ98_31455 [Paraburkholderia acidisoli]QGZ66399.1 hypothetical protein FAZ98_31945 [Paraburkholderia acidisoli]
MKTIKRLVDWNDRRRAREAVQAYCDDRVKAIRALDTAHRLALRATEEAAKLEAEQFRAAFFGGRDQVHSGFMEGSAKLFGIAEPTRYTVSVLPLTAIAPLRLVKAA